MLYSNKDTLYFYNGRENYMTKNYSFYSHKECEFFPCHKTSDPDNFNCLFCYCPLYALGPNCGGNYKYTETGFKDCSKCMFPHVRDNYEKILERYSDIIKIAAERQD